MSVVVLVKPFSAVLKCRSFPARAARIEDLVGAKRIEWSFKDRDNFVWKALNDVTIKGIACRL